MFEGPGLPSRCEVRAITRTLRPVGREGHSVPVVSDDLVAAIFCSIIVRWTTVMFGDR